MPPMNAPMYKRVTAAESFVTDPLTLTGQPLNTETVTLGAKAYTFLTVLVDADGNVAIGATTAISVANLIAAITLDPAGSGTAYAATMTANADATAETGAPGETVMVAKALTAGVTGNAIASTETLTNGSWASTKLGTVYVDLNMKGHDRASLRLLLTCSAGTVTATVEGALRDLPPADIPVADWDDITNDTFAVVSLIAAAAAADDTWNDHMGALGGTLHSRCKIVVSATGATVDWSVTTKRW